MKGFLALLVSVFSVAAVSAEKIETCLACHGANGNSSTPLTPSLGAQTNFFVVAQLFLFRAGRRDNEVMAAMAKDLTDDDLRSLADKIEKLAPPKPSGSPDKQKMERARPIIAERNCANCHGKGFEGNNNVPRIANQREDYLLKALKDYRDGRRIGYGNAQMPETVAGLKDPQLADLAHFLSMGGR